LTPIISDTLAPVFVRARLNLTTCAR
jgi:hypothetical protein